MKAGLTEQRLAASITAVHPVASITLMIANPVKGLSDRLHTTDTPIANIISPYFEAGYITPGYCQDVQVVKA